MIHFAHSRPNTDRSSWQELAEHLARTAELSRSFAPDALQELALVAGLWHDAGKYQAAFQSYIGADPELSNEISAQLHSVPHSAAGAALALERYGAEDVRGLLLALVIEAHHGSLKAARAIIDATKQRGAPLLEAARRNGLPEELERVPASFTSAPAALAVRMLFSALVDADLLDTERWDRGQPRTQSGDSLRVLFNRLTTVCEAKIMRSGAAAHTPMQHALARMRQDVYESCLSAGTRKRGGYTLTVPTGGGKTLSGLAFALAHALHHGMRRVIVVAPYTSIIEQTADVYREALGEENVIEHHSNISPARDTDRNRQACENWDAPVIVTTSVQLLESLHAAHKAPCRKLHRLANSVVLLDEVQTFPSDLLMPIHAALEQLVSEFGATVVHATATQPLLTSTKSLPGLQPAMQEIIPDPKRNFAVVRNRFRLERLGDLDVPLSPEQLAAAVLEHTTALVITHSRADAHHLATLIGPACLHLSAAMCAEHRSAVLAAARQRLAAYEPCLLVSTQLVEAGVDIDFPVVFRAMAGLETLAQAAGRCNRELRSAAPGRLMVYRAGKLKADGTLVESKPPSGSPRLGMSVALTYFEEGSQPDLNDPELFPRYAKRVFQMQDLDRHGLIALEREWDFPAVAERFRVIEETNISIVAPYGSAMSLVAELRQDGPTREAFRALQRLTVGVREGSFNALYAAGWLEPVMYADPGRHPAEVLWTVRDGMGQVYDERFGFAPGAEDEAMKPLIA